MSLALILFAQIALADAPTDTTATAPTASPPTAAPAAIPARPPMPVAPPVLSDPVSAPTVTNAHPAGAEIYVIGRASAGFPADYPVTTGSYGLEFGGVLRNHHSVGLRALAMTAPPAVFGRDTPGAAFGPAFTWRYLAPVGTRLELYPTAALGFGIGKSPQSGNNMILPYLEGGFGAQLHADLKDHTRITVAPELGFVPFAVAPYVALNVGAEFPASR